MDKKWWQAAIEGLATIAWYAFLGALIQALQSLRAKKTPYFYVFIEFVTAMTCGILAGLLATKAGVSNFYAFTIVSVMSLFSSKLLPILENIVAKWVTKKGKDAVQDSNTD